jgi:N-acetylmuramoyl-L-alanine amidase
LLKKYIGIMAVVFMLLGVVCTEDRCTNNAEAVAQAKPVIIEKYLEMGAQRNALTREYTLLHYGKDIEKIIPRMIVLHWTAADNWEGTYNYFYPAENDDIGDGRLNVASHYLVARDGRIFQLTPETALNRHAIGYNWCAIGVENVGGVDGEEDLTEAQVQANIALIRYLAGKYPTIHYVMGHYQQDQAKSTGLYKELVPDYYSEKIDPGPIFMKKVHTALSKTNLKFFRE